MLKFSLADMTRRLTVEEGKRLFVYDDATGLPIKPGSVVRGHPTIGVGRCLDTHGISASECAALLSNDIQQCADCLDTHDWFVAANPQRQMALVDMCFQLGYLSLLDFRQMIDAIKQGDWQRARFCALDSAWARETPERAKRVTDLF